MLTIVTISFLAGILTVLAPCVLPLLPVILGGGLAGTDRKRPYIIIASLMVSLMLFTILLKASTLLIDIHPKFWDYFSGGVLVLFGITLLFPKVWSWFVVVTGIEKKSQESLQNAAAKEGIWGPIGIGAALGPVFSSCNPTYSLLLATVLPLDITSGLIGLAAYFVGLGLILLLVTLFGRSMLSKFTFFANPNGFFRKILGIIIIIVGIFISLGTIKQLQTWVVENGNFSFIAKLEEKLNDSIDTQSLKDMDDSLMCDGTNCQPKNVAASGIMMDIGSAPELVGIAEWINSNPLTLESLRGKVVLVDFWTYSCINCQRTQPYLNAWHDKYEQDGLVILGIHAPEFSFEKLSKNVEKAVKEAGIKYPVALDNDFRTWNAYDNRYWPAKYLIDQNGNIVYKHFGEGEYAETEMKIQELLGAKRELEKEQEKSGLKKTPETYLGSSRAKNRVDAIQSVNQWSLSDDWETTAEYIQSMSDTSRLTLRFAAKKVFLVVSGATNDSALTVEVLDREERVTSTKSIPTRADSLYTVFDASDFQKDAMIRITATKGLRLHAFTFGS
ncbi:redoxin domain-containing protein [Candidatus Gracilibacteria bacterium]|nr:redoxin domain-containing protein [Candidatus Gracilibacteria bacterium]